MSEQNVKEWYNTTVTVFEDDKGTLFTKGPYKISGQTYDYKLQINGSEEEVNVDYCTTSQMLFWKIAVAKIITEV